MFNPFTPKVFDSEGLSIDILSVRSHRVVLASVCCSAGPLEQERAISFPVFSTPPMPAKPAESPQHSEIEKTQTSPLEDPPRKCWYVWCVFQSSLFLPKKKVGARSFLHIRPHWAWGKDYGEWVPWIFLSALMRLVLHLAGVQEPFNWFLRKGSLRLFILSSWYLYSNFILFLT